MKTIITILGMFLLVVISTLFSDFYLTMKYAKGWVSSDRNSSAIKTFIKEEDKCVYFIDVWDSEVKTCGNYELKLY